MPQTALAPENAPPLAHPGEVRVPADSPYDDLAILANHGCQTPIAAIVMIVAGSQSLQSTIGLTLEETPDALLLCGLATAGAAPFIVNDVLTDSRLRDIDLSQDSPIQFFVAVPVIGQKRDVIGAICVMDRAPRYLAEEDQIVDVLKALARQIVHLAELGRLVKSLRQQEEFARGVVDSIPHVVFWKDRDSKYVGCNQMFAGVAGLASPADIVGKTDYDLPWTRAESDFYRLCDQRTMSDGIPLLDIEETLLTAEGEQTNVLTSKVPLRDASGNVVGIIGVYRDVTKRRLAEDRFRTLFATTGIGIALIDAEGRLVTPNRALQDILGYGDELSGRTIADLSHVDDAEASNLLFRELVDGQRATYQTEKRYIGKCGQVIWVNVSVSRLQNTGTTGPVAVALIENISAKKVMQEQLRHDSLHDSLTGLPNRALFSDRVQHCLNSADRKTAGHFAVLFIDLDRFKVINDSLGHAAGDILLTTIAGRLNGCLRNGDSVGRELASSMESESNVSDSGTVARMGGDEFTILLENLRDPSDAARVATRILAAVDQPTRFGEHELSTTASIGIVNGNDSYKTASELLRDADLAMYRAKAAGKAQYAVFDSTMQSAAVDRLKLENSLRHAIDKGEMLIYYQPIVSLVTRKLHGFEALIRWRREGKLISPGDFIPIAEETGMIRAIGAWVMATACQQLVIWNKRFPSSRELTMSINVSAKQLVDPELVSDLGWMLRQTGLNPERVRLEITESSIIHDTAATADTLARIKATGVKLSLDDFGTGYSSLSCLHQFPIDVLKIDRSFIQAIQGRRNASDVVRGIVVLAHNLGMQVVAEGLETEEHVTFLQTIGCDLGQGFLFSKPLPLENANRLVADQETCRAPLG